MDPQTPDQILHTVPSTVGVPIPEPARSFFSILDLSGLNPLELIAGECVNEGLGSYDTRVIVSTIGIGIACVVNWLVFGIRRLFPATPKQRLQAFSSHNSVFLGLTYIFYPTLSVMQLKGFMCVEYDAGEEEDEMRLLEADLSIDCDSDRYQR